MRAISLLEPGKFEWTELAEAPSPGPGQVLVRIHTVGICGTDLHAFRGRQPFFSYPRILGHELAVEVLEVGADVAHLQPGDRCAVNPYLHCGHCIACRRGKTNCCVQLKVLGVHTDGGMRERMILPAAHLYSSAKLSYAELALIETLGIGCHAVNRADPKANIDRALVIGAGPIGSTVMEFLRLRGVPFEVLDLSEQRRAFATEYMSAAAVHSSSAAILEGTPELPTVVFDCTGNPASMQQAFHLTAAGGKLVFVGLFVGDISFHDPDPFHRRELTILSSRNAVPAEHRDILAHVEAGRVQTKHWVSEECAVEGMMDRFPVWTDPGSGILKAVVRFESAGGAA
ncbi:MAG: zinc-binding alcohol dehydrogenase family protein [Bryobacter sp.]|nr:zinc-binding alcohol dehydrogenase family protein [Bryobacter sp.]